jgi:hypothetical protein
MSDGDRSLGNVTVVEAESPTTIAGDKPAANSRYVVARVQYHASRLPSSLLWEYSKTH